MGYEFRFCMDVVEIVEIKSCVEMASRAVPMYEAGCAFPRLIHVTALLGQGPWNQAMSRRMKIHIETKG